MADEREPTEKEKQAHASKAGETGEWAKLLRGEPANPTEPPLKAARGMSGGKPEGLESIERVTKQQVRKDNKSAVDELLNVQQSSASSQAKKSATPDTPKPVRRIQVENVPTELPERPFPLAKLKSPSPTNRTLSLPGAGNAVFLLGGTLAIVALWSNVINPLLDIAWYGNASKKKVTMPASGIISLVLFILLITFISTLSPEFANVAFLFVLGLWAVYLIMNPTVVQNVASYVSQGSAPQQPPNNPDFTGATPPKKQS